MLREACLRTVVLVAVVSALAMPAKAQSMQVYGKTGYLGEYDAVSGEACRPVHPRRSGGYDRPN